jgi:hypothetical protein
MSTLNVDGATQAAAVEPAHRHNQIIVRGQTLDVQRPLLEGLHPCWHDHEVIVAFVSSGKISISRHMPDEPVRKEASSFLVGGRRTRLIEGPGCAQIPLLDISYAVSISQRPIQPVSGFCSLSVTPTTTSASRWTVVLRTGFSRAARGCWRYRSG